MASSAKDPAPTEESTRAAHADPATAAFTSGSSGFASGSAPAVPSMADVAAYLENHDAREPQEAYESPDRAAHTMTKRQRSTSFDSATDGTGATDRELSPRKLARLASGSRFDQGIDQNEAQSAQEPERQHALGNALPAPQTGEFNDQAAQRALSVLRDAEALLSQRAAEHNNSEASAAPPPDSTAAAAAAASTLAEAASSQLAATNAANAANAAAAVAAIAAAAAATQTRAGSDATAVQEAQEAQQLAAGAQQLHYPNESATASPNATDAPAAPTAPMAIPELAPRSQTGSKRHKCPDCDTEFTRHHNLKSHLLTHSQEKPYSCRGCDMSFRRLHDLKRHSKLHTGEKPHICPRCDRKFARGDALARHSKGAGGCAGRRSSSGAFGAGDQSFEGNSSMVDDSIMSGIEYGGADDPERRKLSLPSMKAQISRSTPTHGRAYSPSLPPAAAAAAAATAAAAAAAAAAKGQRGASTSGSDLYPLNTDRAPDTASVALSSLASRLAANSVIGQTADASGGGSGSAILSQNSVVESPKATSATAGSLSQGRPELGQAQGPQALARPAESNSNGDTNANIFSSEQGMWAYIHTLELKLKDQEDRIKEQDEHIAHLEMVRQHAEAQVESFKQRIALLEPAGAASPSVDPIPTAAAA